MKNGFRIIDSDMHIVEPAQLSDYPRASEDFLELPVSDETKRRILWDNCARLYGL